MLEYNFASLSGFPRARTRRSPALFARVVWTLRRVSLRGDDRRRDGRARRDRGSPANAINPHRVHGARTRARGLPSGPRSARRASPRNLPQARSPLRHVLVVVALRCGLGTDRGARRSSPRGGGGRIPPVKLCASAEFDGDCCARSSSVADAPPREIEISPRGDPGRAWMSSGVTRQRARESGGEVARANVEDVRNERLFEHVARARPPTTARTNRLCATPTLRAARAPSAETRERRARRVPAEKSSAASASPSSRDDRRPRRARAALRDRRRVGGARRRRVAVTVVARHRRGGPASRPRGLRPRASRVHHERAAVVGTRARVVARRPEMSAFRASDPPAPHGSRRPPSRRAAPPARQAAPRAFERRCASAFDAPVRPSRLALATRTEG